MALSLLNSSNLAQLALKGLSMTNCTATETPTKVTFYSSAIIRCWRYYVFGLSVCLSMHVSKKLVKMIFCKLLRGISLDLQFWWTYGT